MLVIRPVTLEDLNGVEECARLAGIGIVNLPKRREALEQHIRNSIAAFSDRSEGKQGDYFFVLADSVTGSIEGTCAIYASIGIKHPLFVFEIKEIPATSFPPLQDTRLLCPKSYRKGPSEVCALYLKRTMRQEGLGRLLSISRFLFMAAFPQRFSETVIASLRGVTDGDRSLFWEGLGRHFVDMTFHDVMTMRSEDEQFVGGIIPQHPVYATLLTPEVRALIGKIHPHTVPACKMLEQEGFAFTREIDPIDGGPFLSAEVASLRTVKDSKVAIVQEIQSEPISGEPYLVSNDRLSGFRACRAQIALWDEKRVVLSDSVAEALQVGLGDPVRYIN